MIVYQDILTGDELLSDKFPKEEIFNGSMYKVQAKLVAQGTPNVNIDANPSDKNSIEVDDEDQSILVVDIVDTFKLQEYTLDKKNFAHWAAKHTKDISKVLSDERLSIFQKNSKTNMNFLMTSFSTLRFFTGASTMIDSSFVFAKYEEGSEHPTFYYFIDDLKEIKT